MGVIRGAFRAPGLGERSSRRAGRPSAYPGQDGIRVLHALTLISILGEGGNGEGAREGSGGLEKAPAIVLMY